MKLHRDLRITQTSAWFLAHRIRETWAENCGAPFTGPVEADETYVGGKLKNMHRKKRRQIEHGFSNKSVVAGVLDRSDREDPRARGRAHRRGDTDRAREAGGTEDPDGLHRRSGGVPERPEPRNGQPTASAVRRRAGARQRDGIVLEPDSSAATTGTFHPDARREATMARYVDRVRRPPEQILPFDTLDQMQRIAQPTNGKRLKYRTLTCGTGRKRSAE